MVRGLLANKFRLAGTALAVILGVAFMAGTLVLTDTIGKTFDDLFADVYEDTDAVVREEAAFSGMQGSADVRGRIDESVVDTVRGVEGVAEAEGNIQGYAQLVDKVGEPQTGAPTYGGNWLASDELNSFTIVAGGSPEADDDVVIDKASADDADFRVDDPITVLGLGPPRRMTVSGIATFGTADSPGGASYALFTTRTAQEFVAEPGKFDSALVVAETGISQADIKARL